MALELLISVISYLYVGMLFNDLLEYGLAHSFGENIFTRPLIKLIYLITWPISLLLIVFLML